MDHTDCPTWLFVAKTLLEKKLNVLNSVNFNPVS